MRSPPVRLASAGFMLGGVMVTGALAWYALIGTGRVALSSGWVIPVIGLVYLVEQAGCGCAWHAVVERPRPPRRYFMWMRWVRASVAALAPVSGVGAALIALRLSVRGGIAMDMAGASLTLDATLEMITQVAFTAIGIGLFAAGTSDPRMLSWSLPGLLAGALIVALFIAAQRRGGLKLVEWGLARLARRWPRMSRFAGVKLHECLTRLQRDRRAALIAASYHLGAWLLGSVEIWLVLLALGHPLGLADCLTIASLGMAARSAGFFLPGGLGAQEGGLILAGSLVGLSPETALAVAVFERLRDVAVGVPGLLTWMWAEGRHPSAAVRVETIQPLP